MKATFVELPAFERLRASYLSDEEFGALQQTLEVSDLTEGQRRILKKAIEAELMARRLDG